MNIKRLMDLGTSPRDYRPAVDGAASARGPTHAHARAHAAQCASSNDKTEIQGLPFEKFSRTKVMAEASKGRGQGSRRTMQLLMFRRLLNNTIMITDCHIMRRHGAFVVRAICSRRTVAPEKAAPGKLWVKKSQGPVGFGWECVSNNVGFRMTPD